MDILLHYDGITYFHFVLNSILFFTLNYVFQIVYFKVELQ